VHRAHVCSIPFENLDPHRGVPVALDPEALQRKLVEARRGGYCFEQNLLLKGALEALGVQAQPLLARVRWGAPPGVVRPRTHLVLRVEADGGPWLADVGFGAGTLPEPVPFGPGGPWELAGWRFRLVEEDGALVLQTTDDDAWADMYVITPEPAPDVDIELSNWYTSTHPASGFVTGLIVGRQRPDGTRLSLSDWSGDLALVERTPDGATSTVVERVAVPRLLEERFGLPGFALNGDGRVVTA
jgi:N-hydroxyarylamine O-acetyltransferase